MAKTANEIARELHDEIVATQRYLFALKRVQLALTDKRSARTTRRKA